MAKGFTNEGAKWEIAHSFWILFTWVPFAFLSWFAFIYIGARTKQIKWLLAGVVYAAAVLFTAFTARTLFFDLAMKMLLVVWIISIIHAFKIRPEFLVRLEAVYQIKRSEMNELRQELKNENFPEPSGQTESSQVTLAKK
ncbi:hypothetical protein OZL92_06715 [Bacillus sonorensis]|uniref:Uncharacterized protein n=2 Tax=Bacillus sonorensis TaxID=119858 RepID=M5PDF3_9BACI|nr:MULTISPECIES: hypothetical protein [Bacillus]TWK83498.1 hypothetical protein CHCC20335_4569 [Bacillus paralicheniformis]ASB86771.1 uncharacterized protein S101395_00216 [Bacillus sonorensis]EME73732.1 hypothetical protein BSONL12_18499 [Bacillus sonorensis L12]MCY8023953.1 hypothetical protein [Bacillus sonorensis]MCY8088317.1 hypothetical protein [Bacillus sonorensis]